MKIGQCNCHNLALDEGSKDKVHPNGLLFSSYALALVFAYFGKCGNFQNSVYLKTKLLSHNFSPKRNQRICFSILSTRKYLKLEIEIKVSNISVVRIEK
jgi:hypothetical protein